VGFWAATAVAVASANPNASVTLVVSLAVLRFIGSSKLAWQEAAAFSAALSTLKTG